MRAAFTTGMSVSLLVSAGIAVAGAIMAVVILPRRAAAPGAETPAGAVAPGSTTTGSTGAEAATTEATTAEPTTPSRRSAHAGRHV